MIIINNSVANLKNTPGCYSDYFFNRPLANAVAVGCLFFAIDTGIIYQVHLVGAVPTWEVMGGGGGGSQDLNDVLFLGGSFTNDRTSNLNGYGWELYNIDYFTLKNVAGYYATFGASTYNFYNTTNVNNYISLDFTNGDFALGDFGGQINGTHMFLNVGSNRIYFAPGGVMSFLNEPGVCTLGDGFNTSNGTKFVTDVSNQLIYSNFGVDNGIKLDNANFEFKFGDFEGLFDGGYIYINNAVLQTKQGTTVYGIEISLLDEWNIFGDPYLLKSGGHLFIYNNVVTPYSTLNCSSDFAEFGFKVMYDSAALDFNAIVGDWTRSTAPYIEIYYNSTGSNDVIFGNLSRLLFTNSGLLSGSAGGSSGDHLIIWVNGTQYKIALLNP